ncbi:hypothetical protein [Burkholderia ambifaria]
MQGEQRRAFENGMLALDIQRELNDIEPVEFVILQFPLWRF